MYFRGDLGHPLSRLEKCAWSKLAMGLGFHRWCLDAPWLFSQMICNLKTHGNPWKSLLPIFSCLWIHKWFISSPYHPISISLMRVSWDWTNWSSRDTNTTAGSAHFAMVRMWRFPGREQFFGVHRELGQLGCWLLHHVKTTSHSHEVLILRIWEDFPMDFTLYLQGQPMGRGVGKLQPGPWLSPFPKTSLKSSESSIPSMTFYYMKIYLSIYIYIMIYIYICIYRSI